MNKFQRVLRYYKLRFLRLKGDPKHLARGAALGIFIGITPTIPLHTIAILIAAPLFRANLIAAFLTSVAFCNPLTYFPQYYLSWLIGNALTPYNLTWARIKGVLDIVLSGSGIQDKLIALSELGVDTVIVLCLGGTILAIPFTVAGYILTFKLFKKLQHKRKHRKQPDYFS